MYVGYMKDKGTIEWRKFSMKPEVKRKDNYKKNMNQIFNKVYIG